jgi:hypothetical protein
VNADILIEDIRKVLPAAVLYAIADAGDCLLPEGGTHGTSIEDVPRIMRAALFGLEAGAVGAPALWAVAGIAREPEHAQWASAARLVVKEWADFCNHFLSAKAGRSAMPEGLPVASRDQLRACREAADLARPYWRDHADAAERVLAWLDAFDREEVTP